MTIGLCCSQPARRPHLGLTASWCTYGRRFAPRFFPLHLAATRCGSLRLPSSAPVGSFHPTRFCPCWAHWGRRFRLSARYVLPQKASPPASRYHRSNLPICYLAVGWFHAPDSAAAAVRWRTSIPGPGLLGRLTGSSARKADLIWAERERLSGVRDEVELDRIVRYVEQNPVSAGLATNPHYWPWSSAGLAGESACPTVCVSTSQM